MKAENEALYEHRPFAADDSVLAQATLQIVQKDWVPYLDSAIEILYDTLNTAQVSQAKMNYVSASVAGITDAQLFITYTKLFQALSPANQIDLYREQESWQAERLTYAESHVESHGGSLARLEYNEAFREFTIRRIDEILSRINAAK
jgi:uncharacterized protein YecT (DUF1311 family)